MAIEIVDFPIKNGDFPWFSIAMLVHQRVEFWQTPILKIYHLFIDRSYILSDSSYFNPE